eukprot:COSAG06_NODE_2504_length_6751_cov_103.337041_5_plen_67_part_00
MLDLHSIYRVFKLVKKLRFCQDRLGTKTEQRKQRELFLSVVCVCVAQDGELGLEDMKGLMKKINKK